jgi:hypothetical protein
MAALLVGIVVQCQAKLLELVGAPQPPGTFPRRLHGRQQERDQNRDYEDHDQQFN